MIKKEVDLKNLLTNNVIKELQEKKTTFVGARSSKLPDAVVNEIPDKIQKKYKLSEPGKAVTPLALLFQGGGTARSCDGNMVVNIYDTEFKLADIRKILKEASCNRAERKLARSLADQIHEVSVILGLEGNLYKKIQRANLEKKFELNERAWMSDFQADNPNCPIHIRNLIFEAFQNKKKRKAQTNKIKK